MDCYDVLSCSSNPALVERDRRSSAPDRVNGLYGRRRLWRLARASPYLAFTSTSGRFLIVEWRTADCRRWSPVRLLAFGELVSVQREQSGVIDQNKVAKGRQLGLVTHTHPPPQTLSVSHSLAHLQPSYSARAMSQSNTGEIPSSGGDTEHSLESNTVIVVLGASGDLAKKKVSPCVPLHVCCRSCSRARCWCDCAPHKPASSSPPTTDRPSLRNHGGPSQRTRPAEPWLTVFLPTVADLPRPLRPVQQRVPPQGHQHRRLCAHKDGRSRESPSWSFCLRLGRRGGAGEVGVGRWGRAGRVPSGAGRRWCRTGRSEARLSSRARQQLFSELRGQVRCPRTLEAAAICTPGELGLSWGHAGPRLPEQSQQRTGALRNSSRAVETRQLMQWCLTHRSTTSARRRTSRRRSRR